MRLNNDGRPLEEFGADYRGKGPGKGTDLFFMDSRHKKRRPKTSFFVQLVGRGKLNCYFNLLKLLI